MTNLIHWLVAGFQMFLGSVKIHKTNNDLIINLTGMCLWYLIKKICYTFPKYHITVRLWSSDLLVLSLWTWCALNWDWWCLHIHRTSIIRVLGYLQWNSLTRRNQNTFVWSVHQHVHENLRFHVQSFKKCFNNTSQIIF